MNANDYARYARGDRVTSVNWSEPYDGTVLRVDDDSVYVQWDGMSFDDQMDPADIRPA